MGQVDFINNKLSIGDYVAFARNPYADFIVGKIVGFTPKGIKIIRKDRDGEWHSYNYQNYKYEIIFPYQCVKIQYNGE